MKISNYVIRGPEKTRTGFATFVYNQDRLVATFWGLDISRKNAENFVKALLENA